MKMPYMEEMNPGPTDITGNDMENPSLPFATKKQMQAMPHSAPHIVPGKIQAGLTNGFAPVADL